MSKFEIGDKIRLNKKSFFANQNSGTGTIIRIMNDGWDVLVKWDSDKKELFYDDTDLLPAKIINWRERIK